MAGKVKIVLHVTPRQHERLRALSQQTGLAVSEIMRRALDNYPPLARASVPEVAPEGPES